MNGEKLRVSHYKQSSTKPKASYSSLDGNIDDIEDLFSLSEALITALESQNSSEIDRIIEMFDKKPTEPILYKEFI